MLVVLLLMASGVAAPAALAADRCDSAGLQLPKGFCATVYSSGATAPRHLAVADNGTVYVNMERKVDGHGLIALRDADGDGRADRRQTFGHGGNTGLLIHDGWLYAATLTDVYRYELDDHLVPQGKAEHLVSGLPPQSSHAARGLAIDDDGGDLFVSIGAPSNACQEQDRSPGSKGQRPCPLLREHGGIWRFSATDAGQRFSADKRYVTGLRNMFAITYNADADQLYGVQMGRDQLFSNWPQRYTQQQSAHLPAEQMYAVDEGDDFGWPYCYYDPSKNQKLLNPEYGGDGREVGDCDRYQKPITAFPAHWAPMDVVFYEGGAFPDEYENGAFVAFHGSWNRAPSPQAGYRVTFQPFDGARPRGDYTTFAGAEGFTGTRVLRSPGSADHRPAGLAEGPEGALYISDDQGGTIFKVTYAGPS